VYTFTSISMCFCMCVHCTALTAGAMPCFAESKLFLFYIPQPSKSLFSTVSISFRPRSRRCRYTLQSSPRHLRRVFYIILAKLVKFTRYIITLYYAPHRFVIQLLQQAGGCTRRKPIIRWPCGTGCVSPAVYLVI